MSPRFEAVLRKWRSNATSSVLRARGALQTGIANAEQTQEGFDALKRADIAKHGLRNCALPSCSKTESGVLLPGTPGAGLESAQKGVPREGGGAAGSRGGG